MSEGVAIGIGLAIGFVVVGTILVAKRDEVARGMRMHRSGLSDAGAGPSRGALVFASLSGTVSIVAGVLLEEWLPIVAGAVLLVGVVVSMVVARRIGRR